MRVSVNGVTYHVERQGSGRAVLLLHGFTGSAGTWTPHLGALEGFTALSIDFLGHARSDAPHDVRRYGMEACIRDVMSLLDRLGIQRFAVAGYSMGGRVAMRVALKARERTWALILESASPGIEGAAARQDRVRQDAVLAQRISNQGVAAFVDYWQSIPLFSSQSRLPQAIRQALRAQRLQHSRRGLANSLLGLGAGMQEPVLHCLAGLQIPVLLLAGQLDGKYSGLAERMAGVLPCNRLCIIPGTGHAVHLEQPAAFNEAVTGFLQASAPTTDGFSS